MKLEVNAFEFAFEAKEGTSLGLLSSSPRFYGWEQDPGAGP